PSPPPKTLIAPVPAISPHFSLALRTLHSFPTRRSSDLAGIKFARRPFNPQPSYPDVGKGHACHAARDKIKERFLSRADAREKRRDRKSTRLNSSHRTNSYAVFCLKKKTANTPKFTGVVP